MPWSLPSIRNFYGQARQGQTLPSTSTEESQRITSHLRSNLLNGLKRLNEVTNSIKHHRTTKPFMGLAVATKVTYSFYRDFTEEMNKPVVATDKQGHDLLALCSFMGLLTGTAATIVLTSYLISSYRKNSGDSSEDDDESPV